MACLHGSEPKSTSSPWFTYEQADILDALPGVLAWIGKTLLGLPIGPLNTAAFCAVEPTGDLPTETDVASYSIPPLALITGAYSRLRNQIVAWKFAELCQCTAAPAGTCVQLYTRPIPGPSVSGALGTYSFGVYFTSAVAGAYCYGCDFNIGTVGAVQVCYWDETAGGSPVCEAWTPSGTGTQRFTFSAPHAVPVGHSCYTWIYGNGSGATLRYGAGGFSMPRDIYPFHYQNFLYRGSNSDPFAGYPGNLSLDPVLCTGGPPTSDPTPVDPPPDVTIPPDYPAVTEGPTCASYQDVCNEVSVVYQLMLGMTARIEAGVPKASSDLVALAPHAGLTGAGVITVSGIRGARVLLTTVPIRWGSTAESPRRLIPSCGSLFFSDGISHSDWNQLHYEDETILNSVQGFDEIVYSLRADIVATIIPLGVA